MLLELVLYTIIAYVTNASCTLAVLLKPHPIDFGTGLFGEGKTIEGLLIGFNAGLITGLLIGINFRLSALIAIASLLGDLLGSFIKRRLGLPRGTELPLMDQLGFLVTAYLALSFVVPLSPWLAMFFLLITYFVHRASNYFAYKLGLKSVPW